MSLLSKIKVTIKLKIFKITSYYQTPANTISGIFLKERVADVASLSSTVSQSVRTWGNQSGLRTYFSSFTKEDY